MGVVKECRPWGDQLQCIKDSNSATSGLIASITVCNPTTLSTTVAYPTPTTDNSARATKSKSSDHFMWITNNFSKRTTHEIDSVTGLQL